MENKDKRSIILSLVIGDGCLYFTNTGQRVTSGGLTIKHGMQQEDYLRWKAEIISKVLDRDVVVHNKTSYVKATDKSYGQVGIMVQAKRFKAWRIFLYPNGKKNISKFLKFLRHPGFAAAVWLMDDGSCTAGPRTRTDMTRTHFSGLILYVCDQTKESCEEILEWFDVNFGVKGTLKWQKQKYKGEIRIYPKITFTVQESLKLWPYIKEYVMQCPSMVHKFRFIIERANRADLLQPQMLLSQKE